MIAITFRYLTGLRAKLFTNARLSGCWNAIGRHSLSGRLEAVVPANGVLIFGKSSQLAKAAGIFDCVVEVTNE